MQSSTTLPPSRPAIALSTMNMTTTPTHGRDFGNDTQVALEESLLFPRLAATRSIEESLLPPRLAAARSTEESVLPPRLVAARSANMTTTAANGRGFENIALEESLLPPRRLAGRSTEESLLPPRLVAARSARNMTTTPANHTHAAIDKSLLLHRHDAADSPINKTTTTTNVPRLHDDLVGKDVILYAVLRSDLPVARGTIISTNPNTIVGGQPLGNEHCEVVVNVVMKRDAMLPRPYGEMMTMGSALSMNIAWPFNKVKECRKKECNKASSTPVKGIAGSAGNKSLA